MNDFPGEKQPGGGLGEPQQPDNPLAEPNAVPESSTFGSYIWDNSVTRWVAGQRERTHTIVSERLAAHRAAVAAQLDALRLPLLDEALPITWAQTAVEQSAEETPGPPQPERIDFSERAGNFNNLVLFIGNYNTKPGSTDQISARSQLKPEQRTNPDHLAIALAVDSELRVAGLLSGHGRRRELDEAQVALARLPHLARYPGRLRRTYQAPSYWDEICSEIAAGNPHNDVIALRLVLDTLHPSYENDALGRRPHVQQFDDFAHPRRLETKLARQAESAVLAYGQRKGKMNYGRWSFTSAWVIAEADLRRLSGDSDLTSVVGRHLTNQRDQRLLKSRHTAMGSFTNLPAETVATLEFCAQRQKIAEKRHKIESREYHLDILRALASFGDMSLLQ